MKHGRATPEVIEIMRGFVRRTAARLVRALCAADRDAEADAVDRRAREIDPSDEMTKALAGIPTAHGSA